MLTSSMKSATRLSSGGPNRFLRRFSSEKAIVVCVDAAAVCAEKESGAVDQTPLEERSVRTDALTTDLPTL